MVDMTLAEKLCEFVEKFKEAVAAAAEALKKLAENFNNYGWNSNNWRKLHGMPMRRWRHLENAAYNRRKCL